MSGKGKYTAYVPVASSKYTLLGRLFKGNSTIDNPFAKFVETGDQNKAKEETVKRAKELLQPATQQGDMSQFPMGVKLDFSHENSPDLTTVKWTKAGDPANPYMPDPGSPGPGRTDPEAKDTDPDISPQDIKGEAYSPGQPGRSTARNPADTSRNLHEANTLGTDAPLGRNNLNEPSGF